MTRSIRASFFSLMVLGGASCVATITTIYHDQDKAATRAISFAKEAFIDLNQPEAYGFLSEEVRSNLSLDKFIDVIGQMHPRSFPRVVVATEYEPVPGQKAMMIWLVGENEGEKFDYQMAMSGTSAGYQVTAVYRVAEKSPSQLRKPLAVRRSTDDLR
ncbi:MAG: hypothetical protein ACRD6N_10810 [Pyrinomonadaceae bacterium]